MGIEQDPVVAARPIMPKEDEGLSFGKLTLVISDSPGEWGAPIIPALRSVSQKLRECGWNPGDRVIIEPDRESIRIYHCDGIEDPPEYPEAR